MGMTLSPVQAAGTSVLYFLWGNTDKYKTGYRYLECRLCIFPEYACPSRRAWSRNLTEAMATCKVQRTVVSSLPQENPFIKYNCTALSGHYDMGVYDALAPDVQKHTLVLLTLREPVDLILSLYNFIPIARRPRCGTNPCPLLFPRVSERFQMPLGPCAIPEPGIVLD